MCRFYIFKNGIGLKKTAAHRQLEAFVHGGGNSLVAVAHAHRGFVNPVGTCDSRIDLIFMIVIEKKIVDPAYFVIGDTVAGIEHFLQRRNSKFFLGHECIAHFDSGVQRVE